MNIFFLDRDPRLAAEYHGDRHVVKMVLETAQLLSTAHRVLDADIETRPALHEKMYRATHRNHPVSVWVRASYCNYFWGLRLYDALLDEFFYRRKKHHKSGLLKEYLNEVPMNLYPKQHLNRITPPPLAMPEEFKRDDLEESYRNYYVDKYHQGIVRYDWRRPMPDWLREKLA